MENIVCTTEKKKKNYISTIVFSIAFILFCIYALSIIFPLIWLGVTSVKTMDGYYDPSFFPKGAWLFSNYVQAFRELEASKVKAIGMLFNSLWYAVGGAFLGVAVSTCFAYVESKYRFFGRRVLHAIAIVVMLIPIVGALPAQYELYFNLRMINSPLLLLTFTSGFGLNYLVMRACFDNLSWSYAEAAFVDGAKHEKIFFTVMLPQVLPTIAALFLVDFIGVWNDYMGPLVFMPRIPTLSTGLFLYQEKYFDKPNISKPVFFAGVVICMIPVLTLFLVFQNTIMDISISGGVKE
jgi:raffinose/stachyose/melibiose transport system permease protein/N-acetylglucosamine transport system permease protein